jgi:hypothetical protein
MGSATVAKGYPYPVGTDRVMDGDDAIRALAESLDADATRVTKATSGGQSVPSQVSAPIVWGAATVNTAGLTKTNTTDWATTVAGLYAVHVLLDVNGFQPLNARSYLIISAGGFYTKAIMLGERTIGAVTVASLPVGAVIKADAFASATTISAGNSTFTVARLGRE